MKAQGESTGIPILFNPGGRGGGWQTPRPDRFTTERSPGTHCTGGWVGPRADTDGCGNSRTQRDSIPGPFNPQLVSIPTTPSRPTPVAKTMYKISIKEKVGTAFPVSATNIRNVHHSTVRPSFTRGCYLNVFVKHLVNE